MLGPRFSLKCRLQALYYKTRYVVTGDQTAHGLNKTFSDFGKRFKRHLPLPPGSAERTQSGVRSGE
jgi:hypothetical protein